MESPQVLVICDDQSLLDACSQALLARIPGARLVISRSSADALALVAKHDHDFIICDAKISGKDGLYVMRSIKHLRPWTPVIVLAHTEDSKLAVDAFKAGAYDFLYKPLDRHLFGFSVQRAVEASRMRKYSEGKVARDLMLRIEGIDPTWTVSQLKEMFARFGRIIWARLVVNSNGEVVALGYVEMATMTEAREAVRGLDGAVVQNRRLTVVPSFASA